MLFLAFLLLLPVSRSSRPPSEACWFVGIRFAKTSSDCSNDMCTNIVFAVDKSGIVGNLEGDIYEGSPISCSTAAELLSLFESESGDVVNDSNLTGLRLFMRESILPRIKIIAFGSFDALPDLKEVLKYAYGQFVTSLIIWDGRSNVSLRRMKFVAAPELMQLNALTQIIMNKWQLSPVRMDEQMTASIQAVHFFFDLMSVLGPSFTSQSVFDRRFASSLLRSFPPIYRQLHPMEAKSTGLCFGRPLDAVDAVRLAAGIERLATLIPRGQTVEPETTSISRDLGDLFRFLFGLPHQDETPPAVIAILLAQLQWDICSQLDYFILQLDSVSSDLTLKLSLLLADVCRGKVSVRRLTIVSNHFHFFAPGDQTKEGVDVSGLDLRKLSFMLEDDHLPWRFGFVNAHDNAWLALHLLAKYMDMSSAETFKIEGVTFFKPSSEYRYRAQFEKDVRIVGRALGLCLKYQIVTNAVQFPPDFVRAIYGNTTMVDQGSILPLLAPFAGTRTETEILIDYIAEPAWYVSVGIRDIIGPMGPHIYSESEWLAFFHTSPTSTKS